MMLGIPPEEVTAQFVNVVTNFFMEKLGLHGVDRDGGHGGFYEGGPTCH